MGRSVGGTGAYLLLEHGDSAGVAEHDLILLALRNRPDQVSFFSPAGKDRAHRAPVGAVQATRWRPSAGHLPSRHPLVEHQPAAVPGNEIPSQALWNPIGGTLPLQGQHQQPSHRPSKFTSYHQLPHPSLLRKHRDTGGPYLFN